MSGRTPRLDPRYARAPAITPPEHADYSDELTDEQIEALRKVVTQDEKEMGPLVHEFTWRR